MLWLRASSPKPDRQKYPSSSLSLPSANAPIKTAPGRSSCGGARARYFQDCQDSTDPRLRSAPPVPWQHGRCSTWRGDEAPLLATNVQRKISNAKTNRRFQDPKSQDTRPPEFWTSKGLHCLSPKIVKMWQRHSYLNCQQTCIKGSSHFTQIQNSRLQDPRIRDPRLQTSWKSKKVHSWRKCKNMTCVAKIYLLGCQQMCKGKPLLHTLQGSKIQKEKTKFSNWITQMLQFLNCNY